MRNRRNLPSTCALFFAVLLNGQNAGAQAAQSPADEFIAWFKDPTRQWLATAHLQQIPDAAIPRLLEPGGAVPGPHGKMTPGLLTLAKIGEPAVPAMVARVQAIVRAGKREETPEIFALIEVLRAIGPSAVPALAAVSDIGFDWATSRALDAIVQMEPRSLVFGQMMNPWIFWRAADDHLIGLERAVVPLLPQIETLMDRAMRKTAPHPASTLRPAAYLLARWGTAAQRARGLQMLDSLARPSRPFHDSIESIRALHVLRAPGTAAAIRLAATRVPTGDELTGAYHLRLAIALYQLGESDYGPLIDDAIRTGRPTDRIEAASFLGETAHVSNVPRLVAMLSDRTSWNGRVVGDVALDALQRLTFQDLAGDSGAWLAWYSTVRGRSRSAIVEEWAAEKRKRISKVPMWEANAWIARADTSREPSVLRLVADYLRRKDLDSHALSAGRGVRGGSGPRGMYGPAVVTLLLNMAQAGVPGAVPSLRGCLDAPDRDVRMFGALALAAYEPQRAADRLARELNSTEAAYRKQAGELLLELGDERGIPSRLEAMEHGAAMLGYALGGRESEVSTGVRMFACRDLRAFSQQPLPCDPNARGESLKQQDAAWRAWWESRSSPSHLAVRQARLDLEMQYDIRPVTIGDFVAR